MSLANSTFKQFIIFCNDKSLTLGYRKNSDKFISNQPVIIIIMDIILPILIILVCAKISGELFARIRQPAIIGEMLAGVVLGPSVLNLISPEMIGIDVLAELGIFFLLLLAGMHITWQASGSIHDLRSLSP